MHSPETSTVGTPWNRCPPSWGDRNGYDRNGSRTVNIVNIFAVSLYTVKTIYYSGRQNQRPIVPDEWHNHTLTPESSCHSSHVRWTSSNYWTKYQTIKLFKITHFSYTRYYFWKQKIIVEGTCNFPRVDNNYFQLVWCNCLITFQRFHLFCS